MRLALLGVTMAEEVDGYRPLTLDTTAGAIGARFYAGEPGEPVLLWLPAPAGLEPGWHDAARALARRGLTSVIAGYRDASDEPGRVLDAMVAAHVARDLGAGELVVVAAPVTRDAGHELGARVRVVPPLDVDGLEAWARP